MTIITVIRVLIMGPFRSQAAMTERGDLQRVLREAEADIINIQMRKT